MTTKVIKALVSASKPTHIKAAFAKLPRAGATKGVSNKKEVLVGFVVSSLGAHFIKMRVKKSESDPFC